jgi:hypothetical protein
MEPRLRGADRDAKCPRDLVERALFEMVESEDLAIGDGQSIEGGQGRGALERIRRWISGSEACLLEVDLPDAPTHAQQIPAAIGEDRIQPGVEPALVAKPREVLPGRDERILGGISGVCLVPDDRSSQSQQSWHSVRHEQAECLGVTARRSVNENVIVDRRRVADALGQVQGAHRGLAVGRISHMTVTEQHWFDLSRCPAGGEATFN